MDDNMKKCDYRQGPLKPCAPLALAYVPPQQGVAPSYEPNEALSRGTLFPGLDLPFKNIVNKTMNLDTPMGELMALDFVLHELHLYLDTNKNDAEAFAAYQSFLRLAKEGQRRFVELYGPVTREDQLGSGSFSWINDPWPWEYMEKKED